MWCELVTWCLAVGLLAGRKGPRELCLFMRNCLVAQVVHICTDVGVG